MWIKSGWLAEVAKRENEGACTCNSVTCQRDFSYCCRLLLLLLFFFFFFLARFELRSSCSTTTTISALDFSALAVTKKEAYANNLHCVVTIGGVHGGVPALSFTAFRTVMCLDFVRLYDGGNTSTPRLGAYTGQLGAQFVGQTLVGWSGTAASPEP
jgi:hypothetical protein